MRAVWYESQGPARQVLVIGELAPVEPGPGEVQIRVHAAGIQPGDVKKLADSFGLGMAYPRVIPLSDGAGTVERVGAGVRTLEPGARVWCFGAQSYRAFGTAAEYVTLPAEQVVALAPEVSFELGACLGIPGITAHRALHVAGPVDRSCVLVQGGAGSVGQCALALARQAGARTLATVRSEADARRALAAGADEVVRTDGLSPGDVVAAVLALAPGGVDHVVEVAFHANVAVDEQVLAQGGSIACYATGDPAPAIPFWPLVFKNARLDFLGSDDFTRQQKLAACRDLNAALAKGWSGLAAAMVFPLDRAVEAFEACESGRARGPVVLTC